MPEQITTKPFVSKRQARMAFARKLPFARRWAKQTNFAALPEHKDAGAVAGAMAHGPGGLLSTQGLGSARKPRKGRKWGMKLKDGYNARAGETIRGNLGRSNSGQFQRVGTANPDAPPAFGRGAPKKPRKGRGRKGRAPSKPKQTPEARQAARALTHAQNQAKVLSGLGIDATGQAALDALRGGQQPDPKAIDAGKFEQSGLVEQASDGSYRMTASGRAALSAAQAGDAGRASSIISSARDRTLSRNERHTAAAVRQQASATRRAQVQARRDAAAAQRAAKLSAKQPAKAGGKKPKHTSKKPTQDDAQANLARNLQRLSPTARQAINPHALATVAAPAKQRAITTPIAPAKARTKAQTEQEKAMFANMGGGGSGGSGGGKSGGGSKLWNKGPSGKRVPQAGFVSPKRTPQAGESKGRAADPGTPAHGQTSGNLTKAYGADPNQSYTMRHELVDMADIKASNTAGGGINPLYDPALQPRDRSRASSQAQIAEVAQKMNPDVLTTDFHRIDAGSPIIDAHGNVLSGNGRTLALQRAAELHPDKYADYKASVRAQAREAGIDPAAVDKMQHPVLVRRLTGDTDTQAFAREANSSGTLRMSPLEQAKVDAGTITNPHMLKLHVEEGVDIDRALRAKDNKPFIDDFLKTVPANERANLLTRNGELNQMGLYRVKAAVYTRAFPGPHGERMAESMLESLDPDVKQIQNGISGGLPSLSHAQALIRSGQRKQDLDISEDLARTVDVYARLKDNPHLTAGTPANKLVAKYLGQTSMFGRELNDEQERLLVHIDKISNSPVKVRTFLQKYARIVENEPQPGQSSLFGEAGNLTRAQLFDALLADDATTKAAMKAKRTMRPGLPPLPPVRKRADYSDIKPTDLVMALFHDRVAPLDAMRDGAETVKSFIVYKDASGRDRWVARTTTAYQDRDGEIISEAALDQDSQRMTATKHFGPLRWWHVGDPDPLAPSAPWGPGLDLGDCDYSTVIGRTRVESGTFHDADIARKVAARADDLEMSPGFFHPLDQPDRAGVFHTIRTFERSVVPVRYGRASNLFTGFTVKEFTMDISEMEKRFKAAIVDLGLSAEQAQAFGAQLVATEKDATAQGIAYKDAAMDEPEYPDLEINGIIYKAAPPMASAAPMDAEDDPSLGGDSGVDEAAEGEPPMDTQDAGDYIGDMSVDDFKAMLSELLAPVLKMQDMVKSIGDAHAELKGMYGGVATKDDARNHELITLKAQYAELAQKIATIEGDQPAVILPDEVASALKSAGPSQAHAPDDPAKLAALSDPSRPLAWLGMQTFPELYQNGENT